MLLGKLFQILKKLAQHRCNNFILEQHYSEVSKLLIADKYDEALQFIKKSEDLFENTHYYNELGNLEKLLDPSPEEITKHQSELFKAIARDDLNYVAEILGNGAIAVINIKDQHSQLPIAEAISTSAEKIALFLIKHGALKNFSINDTVDEGGNTLLHLASWHELPKVVTYLLRTFKETINIHQKRNDGKTALQLACNEKCRLVTKAFDNFTKKTPGLIDGKYIIANKQWLPNNYNKLKFIFRTNKKSIIKSGSMFSCFTPKITNTMNEKFKVICDKIYMKDHFEQLDIYSKLLNVYNDCELLRPFYDCLALAMQGKLPGLKKPLKVIINSSSNLSDLSLYTGNSTTGQFTNKNTLFIAGDQSAVVSTIAHETIHYIIKHLAYRIDIKSSNRACIEFSEKIQNLETSKYNSKEDKIMLSHFKPAIANHYLSYIDEELMARVTEVMFLLGPDTGIDWLKNNLPKLFNIFKDDFMPRCQKYLEQHNLLDNNNISEVRKVIIN